MDADVSSGSSYGQTVGRSSPPWWMSVWVIWPMAAGALFVPWIRWAPDALWLAAPFAAFAGAGVATGVALLWHDRPVLGWIGMTNWVVPIVGHHISLALVRDWWAPSMPGDLLGLLASVVMTTVAIVAALIGSKRRRQRASPMIPTAALALVMMAAAGCGDDRPAGTGPAPTVPPTTATSVTTTVPPATSTVPTTSPATTTTASGPLGAWFRAEWRGEQLKMVWPDGSVGGSLGAIVCLAWVSDECSWHVAFVTDRIPAGVTEGFEGSFLLLESIGGERYEIDAEIPIAVTNGTPVFRTGPDESGLVIVLEWSTSGPRETNAWRVGIGSIEAVEHPQGLAMSIGPGSERAVASGAGIGEIVDVSGPEPVLLDLRDVGGAMLDDIHVLKVLSASPPGDTSRVDEVWLGQRLGWAPDGSPVWWLFDWVPVPDSVEALSWPGECVVVAMGSPALVPIDRASCDRCTPIGEWGIGVFELSLGAVDPADTVCNCTCEG